NRSNEDQRPSWCSARGSDRRAHGGHAEASGWPARRNARPRGFDPSGRWQRASDPGPRGGVSMTVRLAQDGTIELEGVCPIEDAEALQRYLIADPQAGVDWRSCAAAHAALVQILLAAKSVP